MTFRPYTKDQQIGYKVGTPEADGFLKRAAKRKKSPLKFKNRHTRYNGYTYQSEWEADYAQGLDWQLKDKSIKEWKRQFPLRLIVNGEFVSTYHIDFAIVHNDGRLELVEVKGAQTEGWKKNWNLTKALLPQGEIPNVPRDAWLTLVRKQGKKFISQRQVLNYE